MRTHLFPTDYLRIPHNALCLPSKFCIRYCVHILLGIYTVLPRGSENNSLCKIWGEGCQAECNIHMIDIFKKITDHNEQEQNENESGLFKTSLIFFANETVGF